MNEKILLIDDEPDILFSLEKLFTREGFQVKKASEGREGIDIFKSEPVDLVITDVMMPGMDGLEVLKQLKKMDEDVEVIILTGFGTIDNAVQALKEGGGFSLSPQATG